MMNDTDWSEQQFGQVKDFASIVSSVALKWSENVFLRPIEEGIELITYETLHAFVRGFEKYLLLNDIREGDSCAVISHNSTALVMQFVALLACGRTFVPINPNSSVDEINFILGDSRPKVLMYSRSLEEKVSAIHDWCRLVPIPSDKAFISQICSLGETVKEIQARPTKDTIGEIVYTSGTTGNPKGVQLTHRNLITDMFGLGQIFEFDSSDNFLTVAPLFHNSGQILTTLVPLYCGGTTTAIRSDMGFINFWHYVERFEPTWTLVMPAHVALMLDRVSENRFFGLKGILCGGAPLQPQTQVEFETKFSVPLYPNYGLTESTSVATCSRPGDLDRTAGTAGRPLGINEVKVFDGAKELPAGVVGEIRIRGENVSPGYLNMPDYTLEKIRNDWLYTGDLGFFNEYGSLQIVDRVDNMVIVGGENVYPTEIERVIPELEAMKEGIVLSLPDHIMGRELIFVYRGDVTDSKVKEWRNHLLTKLTNFKVPRRFVNVAELGFAEFPKAANGKVQRAKLQRRLEEVFGAAGGKAETKRDNAGDFVTEKTTSVFKEIMQIDEVRPDQCMENTPSWDSVNHLQLVMTLEQKFGVTFGAAQIAEITSLDSIIREVSKLRSGQRSQS